MGRRRRLLTGARVALAVALTGFFTLARAPASWGVTGCAFSPPTVSVTLDAGDDGVLIVVPPGDIQLDPDPGDPIDCGAATQANTSSIEVNGGTGDNTFTVDLAALPGKEWTVDLVGGTDAVIVNGTGAADTVAVGGDGDMTLPGGSLSASNVESATVNGLGGNDTLTGAAGPGGPATIPLTLNGGDGNDLLTGGNGADTLSGENDNDTLNGGAGTDTENGGAGDDVFQQGPAPNGGDSMNGGAGTDTADYSQRTSSVNVTVGVGADDGASGEGDNVAGDVENVKGGSANDSLTGNAGANRLEGGGGNDVLLGGDGNDVLDGGPGSDTENGQGGDDTYFQGPAANGNDTLSVGDATGTDPEGSLGDLVDYSQRSTAVTVTVGSLADDGQPGEGDNVGGDVERVATGLGDDLVVGDNDPMTLTGNAGNDRLTGGNGADTLQGGPGDDILAGGLGNDKEFGGDGNDSFNEGPVPNGADDLNGEAGTDRADYSARTSDVTLRLDGSANDGASGEGDNVKLDVENATGGSGNDTVIGSSLPNVLAGGFGNDTMDGGFGNDLLDGGFGNDTLVGGDSDDTFLEGSGPNGADAITGGTGVDLVDYSARIRSVVVTLSVGSDDGERGEGDNVSVENVKTGSGADRIMGDSAPNAIDAGAGNDRVGGGGGNDTLEGGSGSNRLDFTTSGAAVTVDFVAGQATGSAIGLDIFTNFQHASGSRFGDLMLGNDQRNRLYGLGGRDELVGRDGNDDLRGGDGRDEIAGNAGNDFILGGDDADLLFGNAGDDDLRGGFGDDRLFGGFGDDRLDGGPGTDSCQGGPGTDVRLRC